MQRGKIQVYVEKAETYWRRNSIFLHVGRNTFDAFKPIALQHVLKPQQAVSSEACKLRLVFAPMRGLKADVIPGKSPEGVNTIIILDDVSHPHVLIQKTRSIARGATDLENVTGGFFGLVKAVHKKTELLGREVVGIVVIAAITSQRRMPQGGADRSNQRLLGCSCCFAECSHVRFIGLLKCVSRSDDTNILAIAGDDWPERYLDPRDGEIAPDRLCDLPDFCYRR